VFYSFHWQRKQRNYQLEQYFVQFPTRGITSWICGFASSKSARLLGQPVKFPCEALFFIDFPQCLLTFRPTRVPDAPFSGRAADKIAASRRGETLDIQTIIAELTAERDRLNQAIAALQGNGRGRRSIAKSRNGRKRQLTAAQRKRIGDAMRKRWAARKQKTA